MLFDVRKPVICTCDQDEDDHLLHSSMPAGLKDRCGWGFPGSKLPLRQSDVPPLEL